MISAIGTYKDFCARLQAEISKNEKKATAWMIEVGYRPADKDMGLRRWCELSGVTLNSYLNSIPVPVVPSRPYTQLSFSHLFDSV